jgi:hypothetical protein
VSSPDSTLPPKQQERQFHPHLSLLPEKVSKAEDGSLKQEMTSMSIEMLSMSFFATKEKNLS